MWFRWRLDWYAFQIDSGVSQLAQWLAFGPDVRHLEQEPLEPQSPTGA
jgi:hypothetical protein